jgi:hypothetical protein
MWFESIHHRALRRRLPGEVLVPVELLDFSVECFPACGFVRTTPGWSLLKGAAAANVLPTEKRISSTGTIWL